MKVFWFGVLAGVLFAGIIFGVVAVVFYQHSKDREIVEYVQRQIEIETLREDITNYSSDDLFDIPGVRPAVDSARIEFERKRDEALQRFRSGFNN